MRTGRRSGPPWPGTSVSVKSEFKGHSYKSDNIILVSQGGYVSLMLAKTNIGYFVIGSNNPDKKKNAFDLDKLINRRRRPGLSEACEVYEVDAVS